MKAAIRDRNTARSRAVRGVRSPLHCGGTEREEHMRCEEIMSQDRTWIRPDETVARTAS